MSSRLRVRTRLARNTFDSVQLRGYDIAELMDDGYWSVVSVAVGNRRLSREECRVVDTLANLGAIGDPRIWPLKITRLVGSYGGFFTAISAGYTTIERANIGPRPSEDAAAFFLRAAERGVERPLAQQRICEQYDSAIENKQRVPAFGVAGRENDERCTMFLRWFGEQEIELGQYWAMYEAALAHMEGEHGLKPNIAGPIGVVALDLGFELEQVRAFTSYMGHWGFVANAHEAHHESPEVLRRLPAEFVKYVGPEPRLSPRARAARDPQE